MRNNHTKISLKKEQIIEDYLSFNVNSNLIPQKSFDPFEAIISTKNTYISQQRSEDKSEKIIQFNPLDNDITRQLTKSSSSSILIKINKKSVNNIKSRQNSRIERNNTINNKICNYQNSKTQYNKKSKYSVSYFDESVFNNDQQNKSNTLDIKLKIEPYLKKYKEKIKFLEETNKNLEKKLSFREKYNSENTEQKILDLEREKEELKTTINYYIEQCSSLGEEVILLRSKLENFSNSKKSSNFL